MPKTYDDICHRMIEKDYKLTPQRKVILNVFMDNAKGHLSAEDIYGIVKSRNPEIGLATVYRTLELLADIGVLQKMNFGDGRSRYEFAQEEEHHHHHLICLSCGEVLEFTDDLLESLETTVVGKTGFKILDHQLKFYGYCKRCQA
ncbi:MAG: Fur family transcriptional regulator [Carboxydocellales bacterium]